MLARTRIPLDRLSGRLSWGKRKYERVCLAREKDFEVLLIGYRPGQGTSIHDYDSAEAWVMPVSGELQEERFDLDPAGRPSPVTTRIIGPWTISYLPQERSVHRFTNVGPDPCMTLNIYAGPVKRWRVYSGYGPAWMPVGS
ncbi:MAG TPA: cysteine dioxygenase family protein [Flavobacteriales bacterium]